MCYSALYLWLVGFMFRAPALAAFSFGRMNSGPINAHFFSILGLSCLFFFLSPIFGPFLYQLYSGFALLYSLPRVVRLHFCLCLFLLPLCSEPWATVVHVVALFQGSSLLPPQCPLDLVLLLPAVWLLFRCCRLGGTALDIGVFVDLLCRSLRCGWSVCVGSSVSTIGSSVMFVCSGVWAPSVLFSGLSVGDGVPWAAMAA